MTYPLRVAQVCLSLLGTWEGQSGESWLPESSTLLQVLVSIQSLILVPNPWFNEPGYEKDMHTERGATCCRGYNQGLRANTMRWAMINQVHSCVLPAFFSMSLVPQ